MRRVVCRLGRGLKELRGPARASAAASSEASAASSSAAEARGRNNKREEVEGIRSSLRNDIVSHQHLRYVRASRRCIFQHLERSRGRSLLFCAPPHTSYLLVFLFDEILRLHIWRAQRQQRDGALHALLGVHFAVRREGDKQEEWQSGEGKCL